MSVLAAALYSLCLLALAGFALFVFVRNPRGPLNQTFLLLSLSLLGWVASLFAFSLPSFDTQNAPGLLLLGRFNFACIVLAVTLGCLFVRQVARHSRPFPLWLWLETLLLTALTLFTPLVDKAELVTNGHHSTLYGPLFPLYVLHILAWLIAALWTAFRPVSQRSRQTIQQLHLIGGGILATAAVALVTNALLPYAFADFRFIHVGTLSTLLFLLCVGYAVFVLHLFSIRVLVKMTFIFAGLVTLALEVYQLALGFLAHLLPFGDPAQRSLAATLIALSVNAFTHEPVKRWLERVISRSYKGKGAKRQI